MSDRPTVTVERDESPARDPLTGDIIGYWTEPVLVPTPGEYELHPVGSVVLTTEPCPNPDCTADEPRVLAVRRGRLHGYIGLPRRCPSCRGRGYLIPLIERLRVGGNCQHTKCDGWHDQWNAALDAVYDALSVSA